MIRYGLEVTAVQSFVRWAQEKRGIHLRYLTGDAPEHLEVLLAGWLDVDHEVLEHERRWVLKNATRRD